jgi:hypothetical protein
MKSSIDTSIGNIGAPGRKLTMLRKVNEEIPIMMAEV